ncbi:hypothetical protein PG996_001735 [Apiospora saccharicola]|uniref:Uncharacterized protein n=1 Tax=Apiospora saccharicola TaxID=335842 RepID=A0ABR1WLE9_9PEZI
MEDEKVERLKQKLIDGLENRIRPRDEVLMIRRLMAVQLGQSLGEDQINAPLSLVDPDTIEVSSESGHLQGLQRHYVEAVRRNLKARLEFAQAHDELRSIPAAAPLKKRDHHNKRDSGISSSQSLLDLHLEVAELRQRSEKLDIAQKYMEQVEEQPAGTPDFLDPETMYKDCKPLPEVPQELLDGFTMSHDEVTESELQGHLQKLKKTVLRNKLVARKVEQEYEVAQASDPIDPKTLSPDAKLHALNAAKTTLVNWIETQLTKAGDDNGDAVGGTPLKTPSRGSDTVELDTRLAGIHEQYQRQVELRKEIIALMVKRDSVKPSDSDEHTMTSGSDCKQQEAGLDLSFSTITPPPYAYLLTPYLEKIQALSREQKAAIEEKTHINTSLAKQQEDAKLALEHLTQESQLLPKYPAENRNKSPARRHLSFGEATRVSKMGVTKQVEPWIYAADSAKIATLEMVAEKVEEGMLSIDEARGAIDEICKLLMIDVEEVQQRAEQEQDGAAAEHVQTIKSPAKRAVEIKAREEEEQKKIPKTIWSILDGDLGAINE